MEGKLPQASFGLCAVCSHNKASSYAESTTILHCDILPEHGGVEPSGRLVASLACSDNRETQKGPEHTAEGKSSHCGKPGLGFRFVNFCETWVALRMSTQAVMKDVSVQTHARAATT